jgi:hypothetical protein
MAMGSGRGDTLPCISGFVLHFALGYIIIRLHLLNCYKIIISVFNLSLVFLISV